MQKRLEWHLALLEPRFAIRFHTSRCDTNQTRTQDLADEPKTGLGKFDSRRRRRRRHGGKADDHGVVKLVGGEQKGLDVSEIDTLVHESDVENGVRGTRIALQDRLKRRCEERRLAHVAQQDLLGDPRR